VPNANQREVAHDLFFLARVEADEKERVELLARVKNILSCDSFAELRSFHSGSLKTCCLTMLAYNQIAIKGILK
jgi:hypothetical protein